MAENVAKLARIAEEHLFVSKAVPFYQKGVHNKVVVECIFNVVLGNK